MNLYPFTKPQLPLKKYLILSTVEPIKIAESEISSKTPNLSQLISKIAIGFFFFTLCFLSFGINALGSIIVPSFFMYLNGVLLGLSPFNFFLTVLKTKSKKEKAYCNF